MAKKKQSQNAENVQNAYDAYQSEVQQAGQNVVEGMQTAGAQQLADLEAANNAYNEANNAAIEANRQQSNAAIGSFADMVNQYAENIRRAEDEGAAQVAASQRAARWAGATELASSIANLVAVGGHNAVSQQYRPFSQDWMRKADQDARMNRMRIDNLRERQRAMQGQLANLRLNDAARALELAREQAKTNYQQGLTMAETRYNTTINPLNQAARNAEAVGKIGVQAASDVASTAQRDRQLDQSAASLAQRQRVHNAEMMAKGYNPDGTINEEAMSKIVKASQAAKGTKNGTGSTTKGLSLKVRLNDRDVTLNMDEKTYQEALKRGRPDLKKDVLAMAQKQNPEIGDWEDLMHFIDEKKLKGADGKKVANPLFESELGDIARILNKKSEDYTEDDWAAIAGFAEGNYDQTANFNDHLSKISSGQTTWANEEDIKKMQEEQEKPAQEKKQENKKEQESIDKEFNV